MWKKSLIKLTGIFGIVLLLSSCTFNRPMAIYDNDSDINDLSSQKDILVFLIGNNIGVVSGAEVTTLVSFGTGLINLTPIITISDGATISPASGVTQNFISPVTYTVTAADNSTKVYTVTVTEGTPSVGDKATFVADGVSFKDVYVPGGLTFPTGLLDTGSLVTVDNAYFIGETKVTYELWYTVYTWATDLSRGPNIYTFANAGREGKSNVVGDIPTDAKNQPVTSISWRDAIIFSNAITEWYNEKIGTSLTFVYKDNNGVPLRVASNVQSLTPPDIVEPDYTATGFRLPLSNEWELAARYIGTVDPATVATTASTALATERVITINDDGVTYYWTPGKYASGATASDSTSTQAVAWYNANSGLTTHEVKQLVPNQLGMYDVSGNVWEWQFDWLGIGASDTDYDHRMRSGVCTWTGWQVGKADAYWEAWYNGSGIGFRLVRMAN